MRGIVALGLLAACHVGASVPIGYGNHGWSIGAEGEGDASSGRVAVGHLRGVGGGFTYGDVGLRFGRSPSVSGLATIGTGYGGESGPGWNGAYAIGIMPTTSDGRTGVYAELGLRIIAQRIDLVLQPGITRGLK